jgi:hypothetical protein
MVKVMTHQQYMKRIEKVPRQSISLFLGVVDFTSAKRAATKLLPAT